MAPPAPDARTAFIRLTPKSDTVCLANGRLLDGIYGSACIDIAPPDGKWESDKSTERPIPAASGAKATSLLPIALSFIFARIF